MNILFSKKKLIVLVVFAPNLFGATSLNTSGLITNTSSGLNSTSPAQSSLIVAGSSTSSVITPALAQPSLALVSTSSAQPVTNSSTTAINSLNLTTTAQPNQSISLTPQSVSMPTSTTSSTPVLQPLKSESNQSNAALLSSSNGSNENILPKSPFTPDLTSLTVQINKNAPVVTIKVGDSFIINGPKGSKIHPTIDDLNKKIKSEKEAHAKNPNVSYNPTTAINSVISNDDQTITITGVRACTQDESPYPIIIQKDLKYTTVARIRVIE